MSEKETKKAVINRLRTIKGHIQGIEKMVEEEKNCQDILLQVAAVKSSLQKVGIVIMENHTQSCLMDEELDRDELQKTIKIIVDFMK
jgi:CsoR family transcriptional regulator, copper-sensing transcriptional repressor